MTAAELRSEVDDLVALLGEIGLLVKSRATTIQHRPPLTWVSWTRSGGGLPLGGSTVAEYRAVLRNQEYTCVLADGAAIQISYALKGARLEKHRFCWIPSPVAIDQVDEEFGDVADLVDAGLVDAGLNMLDDDAGEELLLVAPVRFDYDLEAQAADHAACHLTFNRSSCRVPAFGPLSLGHFVRFVFRHFYPKHWEAESRLREWTLHLGARLITPSQEAEIFVECRQGRGLIARLTGLGR